MAINKRTESGFALIFVMVFVALILGIVADVVYQTQATAKNTAREENQVFAKMSAKTGVEFAKMLLMLNKTAQQFEGNSALPIAIPKNFFSLLNGQPVGAESFQDLKKLTGVDFAKFLSPPLLVGLSAMRGYFVLHITSENTKINLNLLQSTYAQMTSKAMLRLFSTEDTRKVLSLYGYKPTQLANNLANYIKITSTNSLQDSLVLPDYKHLGLNYQPKHGALESLEELRRVPGFEVDEIYEMFSPYFTVWPLLAPPNFLNVNSAPTELLASVLTPQGELVDQRAWDKFDDFRLKNTFVQNNIGSWFQTNLPTFSQDPTADNLRKNILGTVDSIYRIECRGVVDGFEKTLVVVVQISDNSNTKPTSTVTPPATTDKPATDKPVLPAASAQVAPAFTEKPINVLYSQWIE